MAALAVLQSKAVSAAIDCHDDGLSVVLSDPKVIAYFSLNPAPRKRKAAIENDDCFAKSGERGI